MHSKNAYLRLRIIDNCINRRIKFNVYDLQRAIMEELGKKISISQINKDINTLHYEFSAPIKFDKNEKCYIYTSPFNLNNFSLTEDEKKAFNISLNILNLFKNTDYADAYEGILNKLSIETGKYSEMNAIQLEQPTASYGMEWFDLIYKAIIERSVLRIQYEAYGEEAIDFEISPYLLKEYRNRWYLVGLKHEHNNELVYSYGLDRIKNITQSAENYLDFADGFDPAAFFENSFGNTIRHNQNPLNLILKFNRLNKFYIISNPLHHSQEIIKQTNNSLTIKLKVYESHELNMAILSYQY